MISTQVTERRFHVHTAEEGRHRSELVLAASHDAAAVGYVERWSPSTAESEVSVIVTDCADGREHCFRIDLGTGETAPCD